MTYTTPRPPPRLLENGIPIKHQASRILPIPATSPFSPPGDHPHLAMASAVSGALAAAAASMAVSVAALGVAAEAYAGGGLGGRPLPPATAVAVAAAAGAAAAGPLGGGGEPVAARGAWGGGWRLAAVCLAPPPAPRGG